MRSPFLALMLSACTPHLYSPPDTGSGEWSWEAPENTWPSGEPPEGLEGQGWYAGDVVPDFRLVDQHGDEVSLWQFYGKVIVLDHSTYWCAVCQTLAQDVDETWHHFGSDDFMYLTLLSQDIDNEVPSVEVLQEWAGFFGITAPVLSDDAGIADQVVGADGFPRVQLVGRDMRMINDQINPTTDAQIRAEVEAAL
jgi:peroxiredoxin